MNRHLTAYIRPSSQGPKEHVLDVDKGWQLIVRCPYASCGPPSYPKSISLEVCHSSHPARGLSAALYRRQLRYHGFSCRYFPLVTT